MAQAYPLSWPAGWKRSTFRTRAAFGKVRERNGAGGSYKSKGEVTLAEARERLIRELSLLGTQDEILSTNLQLRLDGLPRSGQAQPQDPGAAVYFKYAGRNTVLACDKWDRVEDNIVALAKHIEAMRGMDRWGVGTVEQAFTGYAALPPPEEWWETLGLTGPTRSADTIRRAWAAASQRVHPDRPGGSHDKQAAVNAARDEGLKLL